MENRKDVTVPLPGELNDAIEDELEYGDSKSGWIREAIRQRLDRDTAESSGNDTLAGVCAD